MTADTRTGAGPDVRGGAPDPRRDAADLARSTIHARRRTIPRPRIVPLFLLAAFLCVLLLEGYVHSDFLADHRVHPAPSAYDRVPEEVLDGGPVIDTTGGQPQSHRVPQKLIALTFDDGPDPEWTPQGPRRPRRSTTRTPSSSSPARWPRRHPDLVERMVRRGPRGRPAHLQPPRPRRTSPTSRIDRELAQNQLALAGAAGIRTSLFRPPYSSFADAMDNKSWPVDRAASAAAATSPSFNDTDSEDWQRPGVDAIVATRHAQRPAQGAIVLMHDSGGNRSQTVAALDRPHPEAARRRATEFASVTEALGATSAHTPGRGARPVAGHGLRRRGPGSPTHIVPTSSSSGSRSSASWCSAASP